MRKLTRNLLCLLSLAPVLGVNLLPAQLLQRGPWTANTEKTAGITEDLPCAGTVLFSEDFEAGIPSSWTVIDGDGLTPRPEMLLQAGWQGRADYRDSLNNKLAVSPSWYTSPGASNDWLITPAIAIGSNSCLSWKAYSQDQYFREHYEIRVATTLDTVAMLANPVLVNVGTESVSPNYSSASLAAYAGQTVYIAFRQISNDKFVLCLDDVTVSNVNTLDIGVRTVTYAAAEQGDSVTLRFEVANYGSDTVTSFQALYSIDGGPAQVMAITAVSLAPNSTVFFDHDSIYASDSVDMNYRLCAWTNLPNASFDQDLNNDTTCVTLTIGHPVAVDPSHSIQASLLVYPNPFTNALHLSISGDKAPTTADLKLTDMRGRILWRQSIRLVSGDSVDLNLADLPTGMYLLSVDDKNGVVMRQKLIKN